MENACKKHEIIFESMFEGNSINKINLEGMRQNYLTANIRNSTNKINLEEMRQN